MDQLDDIGPDGGFPEMGPPLMDGPGDMPDFGDDNPVNPIDAVPIEVIDDAEIAAWDQVGVIDEPNETTPVGETGLTGLDDDEARSLLHRMAETLGAPQSVLDAIDGSDPGVHNMLYQELTLDNAVGRSTAFGFTFNMSMEEATFGEGESLDADEIAALRAEIEDKVELAVPPVTPVTPVVPGTVPVVPVVPVVPAVTGTVPVVTGTGPGNSVDPLGDPGGIPAFPGAGTELPGITLPVTGDAPAINLGETPAMPSGDAPAMPSAAPGAVAAAATDPAPAAGAMPPSPPAMPDLAVPAMDVPGEPVAAAAAPAETAGLGAPPAMPPAGFPDLAGAAPEFPAAASIPFESDDAASADDDSDDSKATERIIAAASGAGGAAVGAAAAVGAVRRRPSGDEK